MVLLAILEYRKGLKPDSWVSVPRYHHQFLPNIVQLEKGAFNSKLKRQLSKKGHKLKELNRSYGNMQAILLEKKVEKFGLQVIQEARVLQYCWNKFRFDNGSSKKTNVVLSLLS